MKTVQFSYPHHTGGYRCSEPGDQSGEYVKADVARDLLDALREAEAMLLVAMRRDLVFDTATQTEIIDGHAGMKKIRAAIAKAEGA